jgi:hypothetical protein
MSNESRRELLQGRARLARKAFQADDEANNAVVGGVVAVFLIFALTGVINHQAAKQKAACEDDFDGDTAGIASCKDDIDLKITIFGVGTLVAILGAFGLYRFSRGRRA